MPPAGHHGEARIDRARIQGFLVAVEERLAGPATLLLVGECSLVLEGWREWTDRIVYAASPVDVVAISGAVALAVEGSGCEVEHEHPGEVVPLPPGFEERARPTGAWRPGPPPGEERLRVVHFDPVSVAFRLVARGDEPDYHVVLAMLEQGWLTFPEMDDRLAELLPRFSRQTIQQDPAEFRRKYKGLRQMWGARSAPASHAPR
jgi:hypothetical protein